MPNELINKRVIIEISSGVTFAGELLQISDINNEECYVVQTDDKASTGIWCSCKNTKLIKLVPIKE